MEEVVSHRGKTRIIFEVALLTCAAVSVIVLVVGTVGGINRHRMLDDVREDMYKVTEALKCYYNSHGGSVPNHLSVLVKNARADNNASFSTRLTRTHCYLRYNPKAMLNGRPVAVLECGSPTLIIYEIAADGSIMQTRWSGWTEWRTMCQRKSQDPQLRTINQN